jgi:LytS/YehU family sensor histidine kinase
MMGVALWGVIVAQPQPLSSGRYFLYAAGGYSVLFISWTLIYWGYYYAGRTQMEELEKLRLESMLKETEGQARVSVVDIDFITGSLQRIQSLIDENPSRSRAEITEFSNLLRNGFLKINDPQ